MTSDFQDPRDERRAAPSRRVAIDLAAVMRAERGLAAWTAVAGADRGDPKSPEQLDALTELAYDAMARSAPYLEANRDVLGAAVIRRDACGVWFSASFIDDLERHREALGDGVIVYRAQRTLAEVRAVEAEAQAWAAQREDLNTWRTHVNLFENVVELHVQLDDMRGLRRDLTQAFDDLVLLCWDRPVAS